MKKHLFLVLTLVLLTSCSSLTTRFGGKTPVSKEGTLVNREYQLEGKRNMTLGFDEGKRAYGMAGRNRFFGRYEEAGSRMYFLKLITTEKSVSPEERREEENYMSTLIATNHFSLSGNKLTIRTKNGKKLVYNRIK